MPRKSAKSLITTFIFFISVGCIIGTIYFCNTSSQVRLTFTPDSAEENGLRLSVTGGPDQVANQDITAASEQHVVNQDYSIDTSCGSVLQEYNVSKFNYVVALSYWEQLTMATMNFDGLVNFARGWHSRAVIPFSNNAEFYGLPSTREMKPISFLYDLKQLNSDLFCKKYRFPPLASFEEFMMNSNRQIRLLDIIYSEQCKTPPCKNYVADCAQSKTVKSTSLQMLKSLNVETKKRKLLPFEILNTCCLRYMASHIIETPMEIANGCGFPDTNNITIIFTVFRGYSDLPTKRFRLITSKSSIFHHPDSKDAHPLSQNIIHNASAFINDLSCDNGQFSSIHLRTAKIAQMGDGINRFKHCLDKAQSILSELENNCTQLGGNCTKNCHRYFVDYGAFGSHDSAIVGGKAVSKNILKERHIQPIHYDPRKYGGMQDQGYVALVEQSSIAHSKLLILVGGGSFQYQMKARFKQHSGTGRALYSVCHTKDIDHVTREV